MQDPRTSLNSPRTIGQLKVRSVGLGCMNFSHAYGQFPADEEAERTLLSCLDAGYDFFDTAILYGAGKNELLLGRALAKHRRRFTLASKGGMTLQRNNEGKMARVIDGRPATLRANVETSLRSLQTETIDLYYIHRLDRTVPIEDSIGTLGQMVREGKLREIGLSEMSATTLRRAHREHPIAAMQTEYSLWTREAEIAILAACKELNVAFVAFSPVARAFLCDTLHDLDSLAANDIRRSMPRFESATYHALQQRLMPPYVAIAKQVGCTPAQLAIAWMLNKHPQMIAIPGTKVLQHALDNLAASEIALTPATIAELDELINERTVTVPRYNAPTQVDVDTEQFQ
jgi:aryl-alcohol dehydrogenase-like predicted oxidoreductase